jgi:hypothetical protein
MRLLQAILFVAALTVALTAPAALAAKAKPAEKPAAQPDQPKKKQPKADAAADAGAKAEAKPKKPKPAQEESDDDSPGARKPRKADGASIAAKLREEWDVGTTRMFRLAVDDSKFSPELRKTLADASDKFADEQESLLTQVEKDPSFESTARSRRAEAEVEFTKTLNTAYKDPAVQKEMARRMKAMEKEIEQVATGADALLASLDEVGATKEQKAKLKPILAQASAEVKGEVDRSDSKSPRDRKAKAKVVKAYKNARKALSETLTEEQKEKLTKKMAGE